MPAIRGQSHRRYLKLLLAAAAVSLVIPCCVSSGLPLPGLSASWEAIVFWIAILDVIIPWCASMIVLKKPGERIAFLAYMTLAIVVLYGGMDIPFALARAWVRGYRG